MWQKPIAITIDGITHSSVRKCCEYYGIKPNTVFNKMRRKKISIGCCVDGPLKMQYIYPQMVEELNGMASKF